MINIQENVPLAPLNSFRVGGSANYFVDVSSLEELKEAIEFSKSNKIDYFILGGGTNLLISDQGFQGLVIRIKMNEVCVTGNIIEAQAGVPLIKAINLAASQGLAGMEKLAGIPGTLGGAVRGNAGAFGFEIKDHLLSVRALNSDTLEEVVVEKNDCDFSYRHSIFKEHKNLIVLSAKFELEQSTPDQVQQLTQDTIVKRTSTGLHGVKCAGSYFMNPVVLNEKLKEDFIKERGEEPRGGKLPAGWVIDQAGLRGKKIGGAAVSEKHANYIINAENASASEVITLVSFVKQQVRDKFGVQLQEEINYVGF